MALGLNKRAVGVFSSRQDAEHALNELHSSGFPMNKVSIIARDADRQGDIAGVDVSDRVGNKADEGAVTGAVTGGALGGLTGLLVGLGALAIPGIGPVMLAGATATTIATTLSGGAIGAAAGSLIGALIGLGIPEERARVYNERVSRGDYLVIVDGTAEEIRRAEAILNRRGIQEWGIYDSPDVDATRYATTTPMGGTADIALGEPLGVTPAPRDYPTTTPIGETTGRAFSNYKRAVGVFPNRRDAESALTELRDSGFPMDKVSVIAKDADRGDEIAGVDMSDEPKARGVAARVDNRADEGAKAGAATGGALGGLTGLLVGLGALAIPGIGPVMLAGAGATALATTLAGGAIGAAAGGLAGALVGLGIPDERARIYNDRVARGEYLVMVDGTDDEIRRAQAIFSNRGIQDWGIYDAPGVAPARPDYPSSVDDTDPKVIIVDRRDETL